MRILVTNDDGVHAAGLWALAEEIAKVGKVIVVAPDRDQSGIGTAVTLHHPVRAHRFRSPASSIEAYAVQGTPADSVIVGLQVLAAGEIDLVMAGINDGKFPRKQRAWSTLLNR